MKIEKDDLNKLVEFLSVNDSPEKADVIFVFGNYKIPIAEYAAKLFFKNTNLNYYQKRKLTKQNIIKKFV